MSRSASGLVVARDLADLTEVLARWRAAGAPIGLVPTMGALHAGHLELVRHAQEDGQRPVVSIFVNPAQFGPNEDFAAYPRQEAADLAKLRSMGVELAWLPNVDAMYPTGFATRIEVDRLGDDLEGRIRPGHFAGVATVVAKLLLQVRPIRAYFGEKDYQQLQIIKRVVRDLDLGVEIVGVPTVRAADGLALSSRNAYLEPRERPIAAALPRILRETADALAQRGVPSEPLLESGRLRLLDAGFNAVDYLELRDAETLAPAVVFERPARLLAAARIGRTRLLDNMPVGTPGGAPTSTSRVS